MTRTQFEEEVNSFGDLLDFCNDNNIWDMEDVLSRESMDEYVWDEIRDFPGSWDDLRDRLNEIDDNYDWYRRDGLLDYAALDEYDFDRYKSDILERADDEGLFDEEPEEEEEEQASEDTCREMEEEAEKRRAGYYFRDPMTGEIFVAGFSYAPVSCDELDSLF